jgi:predicted pyridoxine 5'-phosphate oxidase superfamily flavin-nucleotide-binding protein
MLWDVARQRSRRRAAAGQDAVGQPGGLPTGRCDPITPAGEADQLDKLLAGLPQQRGWRRTAARLLAGAVLLALAALIAVLIIHAAHL